jgi:hypothetical protein
MMQTLIETRTRRVRGEVLLKTLVLEPVGDAVFPPSTTEDDMPLPDDLQLESFGFWRTLRKQ